MFNQVSGFNAFVDNFGSTYTDGGLGTAIAGGGSNHLKNATITSIIAGSAITFNVYAIAIGFTGAATSTASRRFLTDIFLAHNGASQWTSTPIIADLASSSHSWLGGCVWYYFPLYIQSGISIGARCQAESAGVSQRILIRVFGKPTHPELIKTGSFVRTFGAVTATTTGTAMTPGTSVMGSYSASLGTTVEDLWWWQSGFLINDTTQLALGYFNDVAVGDATNKTIVVHHAIHCNGGTTEIAGRPNCGGIGIPYAPRKAGDQIFIRSACSSTPDAAVSGIVYALGG